MVYYVLIGHEKSSLFVLLFSVQCRNLWLSSVGSGYTEKTVPDDISEVIWMFYVDKQSNKECRYMETLPENIDENYDKNWNIIYNNAFFKELFDLGKSNTGVYGHYVDPETKVIKAWVDNGCRAEFRFCGWPVFRHLR